MTSFDQAIDKIREVHAAIGTAEFARLSGVPYTTLKDCEARNFVGPAVETLQKLARAAEGHTPTEIKSKRRRPPKGKAA